MVLFLFHFALFSDFKTRLAYCGAFRTQLVPKLAPRLQLERNLARFANCVRNAPQYENLEYRNPIAGSRPPRCTGPSLPDYSLWTEVEIYGRL